jgi:hypothetical protein
VSTATPVLAQADTDNSALNRNQRNQRFGRERGVVAIEVSAGVEAMAVISSHRMSKIKGFRKSTPPPNRQLIIYYFKTKYQVDVCREELII